MYKALVRPHLDYCDIIYHEPSKINQPPLGLTLTAPMKEYSTKQLWLLPVLGNTQVAPNSMRSWDGNLCPTVESAVESYRYTRLKMVWPPLTLMTNFLLNVNPSIMEIIPTRSMNCQVEQIGTRRASFQMRLPLGIYLLIILPICQHLGRLKAILRVSSALKNKTFLEFTIL